MWHNYDIFYLLVDLFYVLISAILEPCYLALFADYYFGTAPTFHFLLLYSERLCHS